MLVLSRKVSEKLILGEGPDQIVLTIVRISGNRVTVAINAPRSTKVIRGELKPFTKEPVR